MHVGLCVFVSGWGSHILIITTDRERIAPPAVIIQADRLSAGSSGPVRH
jgi:hypothetical protein